MIDNNYKSLLKRYSNYIKTEESQVVFFVKVNVNDLDTKSKWIDVVGYDYRLRSYGRSGFNYMIVELFDRIILPKYPKKTQDQSDAEYTSLCRAITWEVAHEDISKQRTEGIRGPIYLIATTLYNKNRGKKIIEMKPFWNEEYGGFDHTGKVPTTEKAVEKDMEPEWVYKISGLKQINDEIVDRIKKYFDKYIYYRILDERRIDIEWFLVDYEPPVKKQEPQKKIQDKKKKIQKPISKEPKKVVDSPKKYWQYKSNKISSK